MLVSKDPTQTLLEMSMGHTVPRCLHVVANLGVADLLDDKPRSADELASATDTNPNALDRVLRLLAAHGVFHRTRGGYSHTPASRLLRSDHPQSMRSFVRMIGFPVYWSMFEFLDHSVRTGRPASEKVIPQGSWHYLSEHPEESRIFDEAMTAFSHGQIGRILAAYDFSKFRTIVDVGGGRGHLLKAVLESAPSATGVLFDLPNVIDKATELASDRLRLQAGDIFKHDLPVCDAYLIKHVIHDWSDQEATEILKAIRRAAAEHSKLLLIELLIPDDDKPSWTMLIDILMLANLTGRERTRDEYNQLLAAARFRLDKVIDAGLNTFIFEAVAT